MTWSWKNAVANKNAYRRCLRFAPPSSRNGAKAMFIVRHGNDVLPFGTLVSLDDDKTSGIVGDGGSLYLSVCREGTLNAVCGAAAAASAAPLPTP